QGSSPSGVGISYSRSNGGGTTSVFMGASVPSTDFFKLNQVNKLVNSRIVAGCNPLLDNTSNDSASPLAPDPEPAPQREAVDDLDLARVVAAWPYSAGPIRAAVMALMATVLNPKLEDCRSGSDGRKAQG